MKKCSKCFIIKNYNEFYLKRTSKDRKQSCCKFCSKINKRILLSKEERKFRNKLSDINWRKNNPGKVKTRRNRYLERIKQATPKWMTKQELFFIDEFYIKAPIGFHVDHIIPLKGKNICGLHVLSNLQYLSAKDNLRKGNKFV